MMRAWKKYWFPSAPLFDLAVCRIAIVGCQLIILIFFRYYHLNHLHSLSVVPDNLYNPLPILQIMTWPFGNLYRPSNNVLTIVYYTSLSVGVGSLLGFKTNYCLLTFTFCNIFMQAYSYSFNEFHHPEALMMLALLVLALSPSGAVLSIDNLLNQLRWNSRRRTLKAFESIIDKTSMFAKWPLILLRWLFALVYLSAALIKVGHAGLDWVNGYTLQYYLLEDGLWHSNIAVWLAHRLTLVWMMSVLTLIFEGTFFLVLIFPKLAWLYVPMGVAFHLGIYVTMKAPFFQFIAIYTVFVPWSSFLKTLSQRLKFLHPTQNPEIIFDGRLPMRRLAMTVLHYFDWFNRLRFADLETQWHRLAESHREISFEACRRHVHVVLPDKSVRKGFRALRDILWYLPPLWPLLAALYLPVVAAAGPRLYRSVASRRRELAAQ
jgi:hypothetical protein